MKALARIACFSAALAIPALATTNRYVDVPVTSPTLARAAGEQRQPHAASDGRDFFAVWIDSRGGYASLYGTRILADGTVLDPAGILLSAPDQYCDSFTLAWDGANYVVAYQSSSRVSFIRVDRGGTVIGTPQIVFDQNGSPPSIASNGHGSIVIAHSFFTTNNIHYPQYQVAQISQNGTITQKTSLLEPLTFEQIASNGDGYLISWAGATTDLIRLDNNGEAVAGSFQQLPDGYTRLAAVPGGKYLLAATQYASGAYCAQRIIGRVISNDTISDSFIIHDAGGADIQDIAVTSDGSGFQVVFMNRLGTTECPYPDADPAPAPSPPFGLQQIHIGADGTSGTPSTLMAGAGSDVQPAIASNGSAQALVWIDSDAAHLTAKVAAAITHQGEQIAPVNVASSAPAQSDPVVIAGDGIFMTAWSEARSNGTGAIYARRFSTDGAALDASAIKVSTNDQTRTHYPSVSFDGAVWLFIWIEDSRTAARRMALDGTWIDAAPMTIGPYSGTLNYAAASNGNGFAVLTVSGKAAMTFISPAGDTRQVPLPIVLGFTEFLTSPSMAWDGKEFVAVWTRGNKNDIEGIGVNETGQITLPRFDIANTSRTEWTPSIACHEASCVIAWYSNGSVSATRLINGTLVPFNNAPANVIATSAAGNSAINPRVLMTPDGFQLLWTEVRGATPSLFSATITESGIDPPILLANTAITSAAITPRNQLALTLARPSYDAATGGVVRAFLRVWPAEARRRAVGR
jgi:hypothetical protein